jgi:CubicO group peptidase (beta-lactamase class C family)
MSAADHAANAGRIAPLLDTTSGRPQPSAYWAWTGSAESAAICRPGGSGWGTARALAGYYAALLRGGAPILQADTVRRLTEPALRGARDRNFGVVLDRGLGVVLNSAAYGPGSAWYGHRASPRAFGHSGYFSSVAFADPAHDLAVALAWSCVVPPQKHDPRAHAALDALYEDLGLE